ncbi:MAG TPA: xanthine dehydrogenase family protein subunit M [Casimicrobiaceae bacterium]|nr:xanthine dehydrogenase family protein subunit M [Casimicrobiaceae bacterium]
MNTAVEHYCVPASLDEAAAVLHGGEVTILASGTDLMPQLQAGRARFARVLMNIRRIPELHGIGLEQGGIRIGALTTVTELMRNEVIRGHLPVLVEACDHFASDQLRNAATIGGNICNASPAGDLLVPLLVVDAAVELVSKPDGARESRAVPLREFFTGPGKTVRKASELLSQVRVPLPPKGFMARFYKFGTRPALDISAISIGLGCVREGATLSHVRVAFGAVAPTPMRAPKTEAELEGRTLTEATIAAAAKIAREEVRPISDVRASEWYRRELIHNLTKRVLSDVAAT